MPYSGVSGHKFEPRRDYDAFILNTLPLVKFIGIAKNDEPVLQNVLYCWITLDGAYQL